MKGLSLFFVSFFFISTKKPISLLFSKGIFSTKHTQTQSIAVNNDEWKKKKPWFTYWKWINCESCKKPHRRLDPYETVSAFYALFFYTSQTIVYSLFIAQKITDSIVHQSHDGKAFNVFTPFSGLRKFFSFILYLGMDYNKHLISFVCIFNNKMVNEAWEITILL